MKTTFLIRENVSNIIQCQQLYIRWLAQQTQVRLSLLRMVLCIDVPKVSELIGKRYINILMNPGPTVIARMQIYIMFTIIATPN